MYQGCHCNRLRLYRCLIAAVGQLSAGRAEREVHGQDRERVLAERRGEDADQAAGQDARALRRTLRRRYALRWDE